MFRDYDPKTGRYTNPDPIGLEGGINLFAYTGNNPVNWIDANGLIRIAIAAMGYGDEATFIARASRTNDFVLTPGSGKELLSLLSRYSSQNDPITSMSVFSHAYSRGIIFTNNEGFYARQDLIDKIAAFLGIWDQRDIDDLISMINGGNIFFSKDAVVKLFGCNLATGDFAQRLANAINATVIAGKGAVSPEIKGGKETGWMWADKGFYQYSPNHAPVSIRKRIYGR